MDKTQDTLERRVDVADLPVEFEALITWIVQGINPGRKLVERSLRGDFNRRRQEIEALRDKGRASAAEARYWEAVQLAEDIISGQNTRFDRFDSLKG